jgi:threonine dehydrogenase-like Zn-dependent dehydrogenase
MKAVRGTGAGVSVVDLDEPPGVGELLAIYGCMQCGECRRGAYNLCATHGERALGMTADGGMAEQFRAPSARLVPVPDGLDVRDASIVEPAAVSWHALRLAETGPGKRVAVVGAGALGLLAAAGALRHITHRYPIEDAAQAFRVAADRASGAIRVVIEPS